MKSWLIKSFDLIELFLIALILVFVYCRNTQEVPFFPDESQWIATSFYFESYFNREPILPGWFLLYKTSSGQAPTTAWAENYWALTQPPVARYIIALGRLAGGYEEEDLNIPWQFNLSEGENIILGAMPSSGLLWWSRFPMTLLAVASGLLLFFFTRESAGRVAGYAFLFLYIKNPYFLFTLRRAMGESPLVFFTLLVTFSGINALRSSDMIRNASRTQGSTISLSQSLMWFILLGVGAGLAGASKLNGLVAVIAGVIIAFSISYVCKGILPYETRNTFVIRAIGASLLVSGAIFVLVNPFLYSNPIGQSLLLLKFRIYEISSQQGFFSADVIANLNTRLQIMPERIFQNYMAFHFKGAELITVILFVLGISYSLTGCYQWLTNQGGKPANIAILAVSSLTAIPPFFTPLDWDRYYIFPIIFVTVFISLGIGGLVNVGFKWLRRGWIWMEDKL